MARDTITVLENGKVLKLAWAGGINHANISTCDLNNDGLKDLVVFDRINQFATGRFRCFLRTAAGEARFRHDPALSDYFPAAANWAVMRDYDNDGREDLFCSTSGGIRVYRNTSNATDGLKFTLEKSLLMTRYSSAGSPSNLYASVVGLPGIEDIDNDGDLDVLTFSTIGVFVEFHRNMSVENGWGSDSLVYRVEDLCWGGISESNCTVAFDQCNARLSLREQHAGACLTCLDSDGDGDKDLIIGDIACNTVQYIHNTGTTQLANFSDTTRLYPNFPAKNSDNTHIRLNVFPCAYVVDVDGDGRKDLVATPNSFGAENFQSVWYYRNTSTTPTVNFQLQRKNLLQDEMIEVGQNAFPLLFDENGDGLQDLLIGNFGYYLNNGLRTRLTLYRNTGTLAQPVFSLVTRDYANLSAQTINHAMPAAGDVDGDGDTDLLVGTSTGQIHWLENTAGAGNPPVYTFKQNPFNFTTPSAAAAPQLFDLDLDGKPDLLIGMKNGRIAYYRNTGSASSPSFALSTPSLGMVDVRGAPTQFGLDGYATPWFYREQGQLYLLCGSVSGQVFHFKVDDIQQPFTLLGEAGVTEGGQSAPCFTDVNNDGKRDLFVGNASGGLAFFSSNSPYVGLAGIAPVPSPEVFPNPASTDLNVRGAVGGDLLVKICDAAGRVLAEQRSGNGTALIKVKDLPGGLYFLKIEEAYGATLLHSHRKLVIRH